MAGGPGPVALVGSGEFLTVMEPVDARSARPSPARRGPAPTAASREGDARVSYWLELGRIALTRPWASSPCCSTCAPARTRRIPPPRPLIEGAGLVYLSGGDPHHLSDTLRDTVLWHAIVAAWHAGYGTGWMLSRCDGTHLSGAPEDPPPHRRCIANEHRTIPESPTGSA